MSLACAVDGCDKPPHSAVHCSAHHARLKDHGDVLAHVPVRLYGRTRVEAEAAEVLEVAYAPTPEPGRGFLWLV